MSSSASIPLSARVLHRTHPQYGFGLVRYAEEDAFGDIRLQVDFAYLDSLQTVRPEEVEMLPDAVADATAGCWGDIAVFRRKVAAGLVIGENNLNGCFTKAVVQPLPHQAFLVDKVVSGNRFGHLLADDVGLGKTIEAGLIIISLLRREPPQRVLVVCPVGLALQWQDELAEHFDLPFAIMGSGFDGKLVASWRTQPFVIAPIDRLKREEYRALLEDVGAFDLVVCDEAHRLTASRDALTEDLHKTANYRLFEFLVGSRLIRHVEAADSTPRSPRLLLLSGTPHQGDDERFLRLLHLARPDLFQPDERTIDEQLTRESLSETLTRTPKSRAVNWDGRGLFKGHETTTLEIAWTTHEADASRLLTRYILRSLDDAAAGGRNMQLVVALVMHTFHKIAASSWHALAHALERRHFGLSTRTQTLSDLIGLEEGGDADAPREAADPAQAFFAEEIALLNELLDRLRSLPGDSKWSHFASLLRDLDLAQPREKVLIFTQYRATQDFLCAGLAKLFPQMRVEVIHGDMPPEDRREARRRFERESRFLVSTEAGGEGVNLQKACHMMVNYDLPWNPMRLQQRIGRLDRYGQRHVVKVFNLRVPDSWDNRISLRIHERLTAIERTMNLVGLEEDYREMLLGEVAAKIDPVRCFAESAKGREVADATLDSWVKDALKSAHRLQSLLREGNNFNHDLTASRPTLTGDDFKVAFASACEWHGLRLQETRNSSNQFVTGVFHFQLPQAFRDPIFRPSRTCHVVFDREIFHEVRDQDLGRVRGQPIRPVLAGFGEPVTDWLFQTATEARNRESAFCIRAEKEWPHGEGWLFVWALRWLGGVRRFAAPDSVVGVFSAPGVPPMPIPTADLMRLIGAAVASTRLPSSQITAAAVAEGQRLAQETLRVFAARRDPSARSSAGLSLLLVASINP